MKHKIRIKRRRTLKTWHIFILLIIILITVSTSYALWSTKLQIDGTVTGDYTKEPELPVEIPSQGTDSNGVDRYTDSSSSSFSAIGREMLKITSGVREENTITTTITQTYKQWLFASTLTANIKLSLPNNSSYDFTDGKVEQIAEETSDVNGVFTNANATTSSTILKGETGTVTITGKMKGNATIARGTQYSFAVSYMVDGIRKYYYYKIIFIPYGS